MGIILRCLPPEVLAADMAQFEASGAAATEIGLPMNMILGQLPSGKVEMTLAELVPHFPPGYLHPIELLGSYLPMVIALPLMDVVMRIPPDLLSLRPDQKDVDSSVINMADPFTEEILREQAEAAKREEKTATQTNIIDESQAPSEEFVPRDQATATKSFVPPPRRSGTLGTPPTPVSIPVPPPQPVVRAQIPSPIPRPATLPPPPAAMRANSPVLPPAPNAMSRRISPSGKLPIPIRPTSPRPQAAPTVPVSLPATATTPPVGRPMAPPMPGGPAQPMPPTVPLPLRPGQIAPLPQMPQPPLRQSARIFPSFTPTPTIVGATPVPVPVPAAANASTVPVTKPPAFGATTVPVPVPAAVGATVPIIRPMAVGSTTMPVPSVEAPETSAPTTPAFPLPGQPDAAADELKRLAALAMEEMGEDGAKEPKTGSTDLPSSKLTESTTGLAAEAPSIPQPPPPNPLESSSLPSLDQTRSLPSRSITAPVPASVPAPVAPAQKEEQPAAPAPAAEPAVAFNLNNCGVADLVKIPGCSPFLAESIIRHRTKIGSFKKLEDLLEVPGMNSAAYSNLTGEQAPQSGVPQSLSDLLGFPPEQKITLKDVTDRICCWPDVTGCILGQSTGLPLVGSVPKDFDKAAIVAFAPRMFESINKSFGEIAGKEANELIIPTSGTSFHIFRNGELFLIILARLPQMPDRHVKIARMVLAGLNLQPA